jgi:hypothetical protein
LTFIGKCCSLRQDTIYGKIQSGQGVTDITQSAADTYNSRLEQWECRNKRIHEVAYTLPAAN